MWACVDGMFHTDTRLTPLSVHIPCSLHQVHDEEKGFEMELAWVCDESNRTFQRVPQVGGSYTARLSPPVSCRLRISMWAASVRSWVCIFLMAAGRVNQRWGAVH